MPHSGRESSNDAPTGVKLSAFGQHLRAWRRRRGMTQLDLALSAGSTPRYVSFVETGRSRPRRDFILRLAAALDVPAREKNAMLAAAGLRPEFAVRELDDVALEPVRRVVESLMTRHEPFPAWCMTTGLRYLKANRCAKRLFPELLSLSPPEIVDFWYGSDLARERIENWEEVVHAGIALLRREHLQYQDRMTEQLLERALELTSWVSAPPPSHQTPVACPILKVNGHRIRTISTMMRFDTAADVTASELKVELMFPADTESESLLRRLSDGTLRMR